MLNIVQDSALLEAIGCQMEMVRSIPHVICQNINIWFYVNCNPKCLSLWFLKFEGPPKHQYFQIKKASQRLPLPLASGYRICDPHTWCIDRRVGKLTEYTRMSWVDVGWVIKLLLRKLYSCPSRLLVIIHWSGYNEFCLYGEKNERNL